MRRSFQFLSVYTKDKLLFGLYISLRVVLQCKRTKVFSAGFSHPGDHTIYSVSNSPPNSTQYSLHQGRLRVCFKCSSLRRSITMRHFIGKHGLGCPRANLFMLRNHRRTCITSRNFFDWECKIISTHRPIHGHTSCNETFASGFVR